MKLLKKFNPWFFFSILITFLLSLPILSILINVIFNYNIEWNEIIKNEIWDYLINSSIIVFFQIILVIFFGVLSAWIVTIYNISFRKIIDLFLLLPLSIPPYIAAIAYGEIYDYFNHELFSNENDNFLNHIDIPNIRSLPGVIFIFSITLYPYVYIASRAAFSEISHTYNEVGKVLGSNSFDIFFKIFLPLSSFPIVGGIILSILESLNDFGTVQYFGIDTFTTGIYKTWVGLGDINLASQISMLFLFIIFFIIFLQRKLIKRKDLDLNIENKNFFQLKPVGKIKNLLLMSICLLPVILGFIIPLYFLLINSIQSLEIFLLEKTLINTFNTVILSLVVSLIIVFLTLIVNFSYRILDLNENNFFRKISSMGYAIPGSIVAIGILIPFTYLDNKIIYLFNNLFELNLSNIFAGSLFILCFAYIVRFFTISQTNLESSFMRISKNLDDNSKILGEKPFVTLFNIHIPIMSLSIILTIILIFIEIIKELSATLILRPFNFDTLAIQVYEYASEERIIESSIPSLIIVVLCVLGIIFITKIKDFILKSEQKK